MSAPYVLINAERMEELRERSSWTLEQEGALVSVICLIGIFEGPILLNDQAIAASMKTTTKKWLELRDGFIKLGILCLTDEGFVYVTDESNFLKFPGRGRRALPSGVHETARRRTNNCCAYCGTLKGPFHSDHLLPHIRGGSDAPNNIVLACRTCNTSKSDKTLMEWVAFLTKRNAA